MRTVSGSVENINDSVAREEVTKEQMRKFLKFVHDDNVYCKYCEVLCILFHTGLRISEFCGLKLRKTTVTSQLFAGRLGNSRFEDGLMGNLLHFILEL